MNFKSFCANIGMYILVVLSYFLVFMTIAAYSFSFLNAGFSAVMITLLFAVLSFLYCFGLWKWYQLDFRLEVINSKLTGFVWLPLVLLAAYILFQNFVPIEASDNQTIVVSLIRSQPLFSFFFVVIVGPIVEEFMTRGLLANYLFPEQKSLPQILLYLAVSGTFFSLLHQPGTLPQFLLYFVMGAIFALAYVTKKDLRYPIALHMANNLIAFLQILFLA
ncbi:CPBP family intramembrane glutamic endopeptidase [Streptococcus panodentis]|uniref:CPBP family intramembrane metalloprotease n=1 Tax=Streptococcus panodentis TaxID=1581472 RepID=A0ABS5AUA7_9STRE|nr:type II CAAX endopeptidase family protein [Streptococcus panodentis]MBP2620159.1 CPBP family intramembrane metalloprotease [Streptococcus panodentis]